MEKSINNSEETLARWWNEHSLRLRNRAKRMVGDQEFADDLMQQVAIAVLIHKDSFKNEAHFARWTVQKLRWLSLDFFRKRDRERSIFDRKTDLDGLSTHPTQERHQLVSELFDEIKKLPGRQREVAERYYIQHQDTDRIARDLKIEKSTVRSFLRHARSILAERFATD